MLFANYLTIIRGGGDLATGVAYRLHKAGFPLIVLELARPSVIRRRVALATAVLEGSVNIEDMRGQLAHSFDEALALSKTDTIPVLASPALTIPHSSFSILIDARIAKRNIDTSIDQAPLVIGMGPGFTAGVDCHAVIETMRGHALGRVIWQGSALPNTGTPGIVAGKGAERVLRAPAEGVVNWRLDIGDYVEQDTVIGDVNGAAVTAPFDGVIRGLIAPETAVSHHMKIGDVDARGTPQNCFTISDKALAMGGAVLEAILTYLNRVKRDA
ncbi:MAG: EF2563 family selenium-dependent molybdenum hydroxylase system protein [Ardenticatenaceae bacterium]|nr:EF2563 family selenium-dependent molybdenum hydroxylase system protein [Ardenticatenaceae bacterium]